VKFLSTLLTIAFAICLFASSSSAQTPAISGIGMSNGSTPLRVFYYWSIYGSNLSTGSASYVVFQVGGELYYPPYTVSSKDNYFSSTLNNPGYWYESSSQINFWSQAYNFPPYYLNGVGYIGVCNSSGLCSSGYYVPVQA
jgi:hypothetical protein